MHKMKTIVPGSLVLISLLSFTQSMVGQISVLLQRPPPYQFKIEHMWKVTLVNPTQTTYRVSLHGRATETDEGLIVDATTATFSLPPGMKTLDPRELAPLSVQEANPAYGDVVKNIGGVPTGDYEICVAVIDAGTSLVIGEECIQSAVQNLTNTELLEPANGIVFRGVSAQSNPDKTETGVSGNETTERLVVGQFVNFSWLPPSPIPPGSRATYTLRITEMYGRQSAYNALHSNPAIFEMKHLTRTMVQYPNAARSFKPGMRYAWQLQVYLNGSFISESEIWEFGMAAETPSTAAPRRVSREHIEKMNPSTARITKSPDNDDRQRAMIAPLLYASLTIDREPPPSLQSPQPLSSTDKPWLQFSGDARFASTLSSRVASFSEQPKNHWTTELTPVLTFYGIPFTASVLLSSMQESGKQSLGSFGLNFDLERMRDNLAARLEDEIGTIESSDSGSGGGDDSPGLLALKDPTKLKDNLDRLGLISGGESAFMSILALGVGTNYPSYTEYTLNGVPVTGLNVEINPGIFYAAFTSSASQRGIDSLSFGRRLYAGRIGLGKTEATHLYFTGLYAKDDDRSIRIDPSDNTLTPKANQVFGTEAKLNLYGTLLALQGEAAFAVLTRDTRDADLVHASIPSWVTNIIEPKISTSFDYSYSGKLAYTNDASATRISLGIKMIGPGYTSLGVPNLRTDQFGYEGKFDQQFFGRAVSIGTFYKRYNDNLIQWKQSRTTTTGYGINLGFTFPDIPFLRLSYSPHSQSNDDLNPLRKIDNATSVYSAMIGYSYRLFKLNSSTTFMYSGQDLTSLDGSGDYRTESFMLSEIVHLAIPLSLTANWGLIQTGSAMGDSKITTIDVGANAEIVEGWSILSGATIASEADRNRRTGLYISSDITPMQGITIGLRTERNVYKEELAMFGEYSENLFTATLSAQW